MLSRNDPTKIRSVVSLPLLNWNITNFHQFTGKVEITIPSGSHNWPRLNHPNARIGGVQGHNSVVRTEQAVIFGGGFTTSRHKSKMLFNIFETGPTDVTCAISQTQQRTTSTPVFVLRGTFGWLVAKAAQIWIFLFCKTIVSDGSSPVKVWRFLLNSISRMRSFTQGPALQAALKKVADAFIRFSVTVRRGSHCGVTTDDSKNYKITWKTFN